MVDFNWLHLTDLHRGMRGQHWLWPGVKERFFEDLKRLHQKAGPWDIVLFTGDLAQKGESGEFAQVDDILGELWQHLAELGSTPGFLAIPGNHDLARPNAKEPAVLLLQEFGQREEVRDQFWDDPGSAYRQVVTGAFAAYHQWWDRQPNRPARLNTGLLPGDFSTSVEKQGARLGILGLNSTFLQLTAGDYTGKLAVDVRQFHEACNGDGIEWARQHHACILLTHQPPAWLDTNARQHLEGEIADHGRFALHLCGHMHEVAYRQVSEAGTGMRRLWQGRSLFGLEYFGDTGKQVRLHGYAAGRITIEEKTGMLTLWPREARLQGAQREIVPDYSVVLTDDQHTQPQSFPLLSSYATPLAGSISPALSAQSSTAAPPAMQTSLTLSEFIKCCLDALANAANTSSQAKLLLNSIGCPSGEQPSFDKYDTPKDFWLEVGTRISAGKMVGSFEHLLSAAARQYPYNSLFARFAPNVP